MRYSKLLIPTTKETPAEAEIPSHQLLLRAGYARKVASGTYAYLILGHRCLKKIMAIVKAEMDAAGAQDLLLPILQPIELWQKTGRDVDYGDTLSRHIDRHGRTNVLAPTAEEVVTDIVAREISSYKQLPINLYQVNAKFRDEFRPRFGALRSREFIMKDAYSFDATEEGLDKSYQTMHDVYCRIFERCGLDYVVVDAASGEIGGTGSQEFMIRCDAGEDLILSSENGDYAANVETAGIGTRESCLTGEPTGERDTVHTPELKTIDEVGKFLKVKAPNFLKTLVFQHADGSWVIAVVRGDHDLNENKLKALAGQDITMEFDLAAAEAAGFAIGFVGPDAIVGKSNVTLYVDHDAAAAQFWAAGANETDYHVKHFNWQRDVVAPLGDTAEKTLLVADIRNAAAGDPSPKNDGQLLKETRGIEVGHIFKLGTKYSIALDATFLDEDGQSNPCVMGCYGIGINRILAGAIEQLHDESGIVLPMAIAPFEVEIIPIGNDKPDITAKAEELYAALQTAGIDVLLDDRDARPGVKFKDSELIGIPLRVVVGERGLSDGKLELKRRTGSDAEMIDAETAAETVAALVREMRELR